MVAVRYGEMTSLRAAAEITGANFAFDRVTPLAACPDCSMGNREPVR